MNLSADTDTVDLIREDKIRSGIFGFDIELITYQFCIFVTKLLQFCDVSYLYVFGAFLQNNGFAD